MGNDKRVAIMSTDWIRAQNPSTGKVEFVRPLVPGGCAWYRCVLPFISMAEFGWESDIGIPGFNEERGFGIVKEDDKEYFDYPIVFFKLIMHRTALNGILRARELGQKVVVDVDDFFVDIPKSNVAYEGTSSSAPGREDDNRDIYEQILFAADALVCSTQFLYDYYSSRRSNVFMVRNAVDLKLFKRRKDKGRFHPTVGWSGMTPYRGHDLYTLPFLGEFLEGNGLKFHHSGWNPGTVHAHTQLGISDSISSFEGQQPVMFASHLYQRFDVGIVPLAINDFNKSKSYLKGLEMVACGIPFIAQGLPEYQWLFDAGVGRVANSVDEWLYHLGELLDPTMRKDESDINYEIVKENFTMKQAKYEWNKVFEEILSL